MENPAHNLNYRNFLKDSIPNILAYISIPLASLFDIAFLGHLPSVHTQSGVALATIIFDYLFWGCSFLRVGTIGLVSQADGENRNDRKLEALLASTLLALAIATTILLFQHSISQLSFKLLMGDINSEQEGLSYFSGRVLGSPFILLLYCFQGLFIGSRRFYYLLITILTQNIGNIVLDYIFIFHFSWGAFGAGLATSLSELIALMLAAFLSLKLFKNLSIKTWKKLHLKESFKSILSIHLLFSLRTLLLITSFAVFTNLSAFLGSTFVACNAILMRIMHLSSYFIDGFATTLEGYSGYLFKKKNIKQLNRIFYYAFSSTSAFLLFFNGTLFTFSNYILPIFSNDYKVLELLKEYLPFMIITGVTGSLAFLYDGLFIGISRAKTLFLSMLFSCLVGLVPCFMLFVYYQQGVYLWYGLIGLMAFRSLSLFREKIKVIKNAKGGI
ncbi:MAG: MATE family efflux transporter [Chlamydiales bacterium]|nr:MATE family efflux transporter [Chlamydiales bacterium]NCF70096.1 MATE family efflux transporter [Chlamydiales bacterium]